MTEVGFEEQLTDVKSSIDELKRSQVLWTIDVTE